MTTQPPRRRSRWWWRHPPSPRSHRHRHEYGGKGVKQTADEYFEERWTRITELVTSVTPLVVAGVPTMPTLPTASASTEPPSQLPEPAPTDGGDEENDDEYDACAVEFIDGEELELLSYLREFRLKEEEEALLVLSQSKRETKAKKKTDAQLSWEWLDNVKLVRRKWARCFVMDVLTLGCFSTQRIESWHNAIKKYMSKEAKKMLDLKVGRQAG